MESLYGFADALHETLLQDHRGFIDLLPAISDLLGKISFTKMRSVGGVLVSCKGDKNGVTYAKFESKKQIEIKVKNNFGASKLSVITGGKESVLTVEQGEIFSVAVLGKVEIAPAV